MVIGGSGGIGEAIVFDLLGRGCERVVIVDRVAPRINDPRVEWVQLDLSVDRVEVLASRVDEADALVVTAGIGRLDRFATFDVGEVERTMRVNAIAPIGVLQLFAKRLISERPFYATVITSIAALVSSPLYAVYSSSKGALSRYVEAVNAELAGEGLPNRVLEVAPGKIDGTGFHGEEQRGAEALMPLAGEIVDAMLARGTRLVPNAEVYGGVIARYQADPVAFGESSYRYKLEHAALESPARTTVGYLSGTFDLFHVGHLRLLARASACCDRLVVGAHTSGAWKGKDTFIPLDERMEILRGCRYVDEVIEAPDDDADAWEIIHYDMLFVGSDYKGTERFNRYERDLGAKGVRIVYFPYTQGTSSTQIRRNIVERSKEG